MVGKGFSNLWVPLTASGSIVAAFYCIYWGGIGDWFIEAFAGVSDQKQVFLTERPRCSLHVILPVQTPLMEDDNPLLCLFNLALKAAF